MTALEKVFGRIEAFKDDMEDLGVDVTVSIAGVARGGMKGPSLTLISVVLPELEDLEAEG